MGRLPIRDNKGTHIEIIEDDVVKEINKLDNSSVSLVFFDPFLRLNSSDGVSNLSKDIRDKHIENVQMWLQALKPKLTLGANIIIGVDNYSITSFGESLFATDNVNRILSWLDYSKLNNENYINNMYTSIATPYLWVVYGKSWTFNLLGDEKTFKSEFIADTPEKFTEEVILRFSNESDIVFEIFGDNNYIKNSCQKLNRKYYSGNNQGVL